MSRPHRSRTVQLQAVVVAGSLVATLAAVALAGSADAARRPCGGKGCKPGPVATASPSPTSSPTTTDPTPTASPAPTGTETATAGPTPTATVTTSTAGPNPTSSPTATSGTSGPSSTGSWVSPEGMTVVIDADVTGWTFAEVYDVVRRNAYQLGQVGPTLKVRFTLAYGSMVTNGVSQSGGAYSGYRSTIYINAGQDSTINVAPDRLMAHQYGHSWSMYHLYLSHQGDWSSYLKARNVFGDVRLDSTHEWEKEELVADDYRLLFGSDAAVTGTNHLNTELPDPRDVPGLRTFLADGWG